MTITNAIISFYCSCTTICCPPTSKGLTASGVLPTQGITIATGQRELKLGTKLLYGTNTYIIQDRMHRRYDNTNVYHFDVYMTNHQQALKKGRLWNQTVTIIK